MRSFLVAISLALTVFAQNAAIFAPAPGKTLVAGKHASFIIERPNSLTGSSEVGIAIALHHCLEDPCEDASERLGDVIYSGYFNPQLHSKGPAVPHEYFTVAVPPTFPPGPAVVSVPHSSLVGAGPFFFNEILNVTVNIEA